MLQFLFEKKSVKQSKITIQQLKPTEGANIIDINSVIINIQKLHINDPRL